MEIKVVGSIKRGYVNKDLISFSYQYFKIKRDIWFLSFFYYIIASIPLWITWRLYYQPTIVFFFGITGGIFLSQSCNSIGLDGGVSLIWLFFSITGIFLIKFKYRLRLFGKHYEEIVLILFLSIMIYSLSYTPSPIYGRSKVVLFAGSCFPLFFLGRLCGSTPKLMLTTFSNSTTIAILTVVYFLFDFIENKSNLSSMDRYGSGMSILFGIYLNCCIAILFYSIIRHKGRKKIISIITVSIALLLLPFTGSRGAILIPVIISFFTFLSLRKIERSIFIIVAILSIGVFTMHILAPAIMKKKLEMLTYETSGRASLFSTAIELIKNHPLRGVGAGGFSRYNSDIYTGKANDRRSYPHNLWLEIGSEQGIIGLIPLVYLTIIAFNNVIKIRRLRIKGFSESVQMLFGVSFIQTCFTSDLPAFRSFFLMMGFLIGFGNQYHQIRKSLSFFKKNKFKNLSHSDKVRL